MSADAESRALQARLAEAKERYADQERLAEPLLHLEDAARRLAFGRSDDEFAALSDLRIALAELDAARREAFADSDPGLRVAPL